MADDERSKRLKELRERRVQREKNTNEIVDKILAETISKPAEEAKVEAPKLVQQEHHEAKPQKKKQDIKLQHFVGEIFIPPKEKIEMYSQEIQVDLDEPKSGTEERSPIKPTGRSGEDEGQIDLPARPAPKASEDKPELKTQDTSVAQDISQEEIKNILKSKDFLDFFDRSTKMIEKALDSKNIDLFEDILLNEDAGQFEDGATKKEFQEVNTFFDQQLASNRVVTSLDWAPHLPELFLASYSQSFEGNPNDPQGVLLLWSLSLRSRPEFTCYCQSQITVAKFNQFSTSTIIGGTYSGQIVVWDLRAKSTPVQRSGMAAGGHAHPVYSLNIVGTQNSHNIVSLSNDGKLCVWNTTMLNSPQREIDLKFKSQAEGNPLDVINPTCLTFPHEEANNFYVGVEDGTIFSAQVHGNQANENILESFAGHQAPITSLSIMPNFPDVSSDVSNLLLSSSYDWTVKLWNPKSKTEPLCSFESAEDYIYDVAWSPLNPTLFASLDGEGYIDLWDLSKDLEVPYVRHKGDTRALNQISWSKDGSKILTGSANGYLKLYGLSKNLLKPTEEGMDKFETQIYNFSKK